MWRHKRINLRNYGIWRHFRIERPYKRVLAKNYLLIVISSRNIKDENLLLPHINLSNFESVLNWRNWNKFWRVCMGCYQTSIPYISIGNCNSELIFGVRASFRILYKNMTSYPIISKILFLWRHHFRTLLIINTGKCSHHHAVLWWLNQNFWSPRMKCLLQWRPYRSQFPALGWLLKYYACVKPALL